MIVAIYAGSEFSDKDYLFSILDRLSHDEPIENLLVGCPKDSQFSKMTDEWMQTRKLRYQGLSHLMEIDLVVMFRGTNPAVVKATIQSKVPFKIAERDHQYFAHIKGERERADKRKADDDSHKSHRNTKAVS